MLREYIISEAMFALGIPTTRSLAVVTTGESVYRATALRGAVLTRVAASHIRVGTFQYLAARRDDANLRLLADYAIDRHFPEFADAPQKHLEFLRAVTKRQASLIARWQLVGFIHGVMNTDNMAISGETIDYGPCAFMNAYHPATVFSSIDNGGRYAYGNQPARRTDKVKSPRIRPCGDSVAAARLRSAVELGSKAAIQRRTPENRASMQQVRPWC